MMNLEGFTIDGARAFAAGMDCPIEYKAFRTLYFAQGEEGATALAELDAMGAESWLDMMDGAAFASGDWQAGVPWGASDSLIWAEPADAFGHYLLTVNRRLGYVALTEATARHEVTA